ncbi:nexilin-like [Xyrauchen texanus]|uniref:nexilin-like n=1 Tax=Xyrauchen texanus TaxID=154827 RepID=UPI002241A52E|nr:nexilin-like [Xyrauchen texanus]
MTEVMSMADVSTGMMYVNDTENTNKIADADDTNMTSDENYNEEEKTTSTAEMLDISCATEEVEMNGNADVPEKTMLAEREEPKQETKTFGKTRKRERVLKTNDANITQEEDINDVADASHDTNVTNMSEVAVKQEKLLKKSKPVQRSYIPKLGKEDVKNKFEAMQKAREERNQKRSQEEQKKRREQYVKEREYSRKKQMIKELLASSDEEEEVKPTKIEKSYVPKITGSVKGKFAEMEKQRQEEERKRTDEERKKRAAQEAMEKAKIKKELAKKAEEEGDDGILVRVVPAKSQKHPGKIKINFEDMEKSREEELKKRTEEEKKKRYDENRRSFREAKRCSLGEQLEDLESQPIDREQVTPGKLHLTFEELEKERQEQQRKKAEEEARHRLEEERKAFEVAKLGMPQDDEDTQVTQGEKEEFRPGKLRLSFEELEKQRLEEEHKRVEEGRKRRIEEERKAFAEARKSMIINDDDDDILLAMINSDGAKPGKLAISFEELERQRQEEEQKRKEEEAKRRLEEEKILFAEARKNMEQDISKKSIL